MVVKIGGRRLRGSGKIAAAEQMLSGTVTKSERLPNSTNVSTRGEVILGSQQQVALDLLVEA